MHMPARKDFNKRKELDVQTLRLISKFIMAMKMHRLVNLRFVIAASIKWSKHLFMTGVDMLGAQTSFFC